MRFGLVSIRCGFLCLRDDANALIAIQLGVHNLHLGATNNTSTPRLHLLVLIFFALLTWNGRAEFGAGGGMGGEGDGSAAEEIAGAGAGAGAERRVSGRTREKRRGDKRRRRRRSRREVVFVDDVIIRHSYLLALELESLLASVVVLSVAQQHSSFALQTQTKPH